MQGVDEVIGTWHGPLHTSATYIYQGRLCGLATQWPGHATDHVGATPFDSPLVEHLTWSFSVRTRLGRN